jgi:hypothetical protein
MRVKTLVVASAWTAGFGISGWLAYAQNSSNDVNGAVSQIIPGTNISISPSNGKGQVTINASGGSSGSGNATSVNGGSVPTSCAAAIGTNASGQLTCLSTSTVNTSGTAGGLTGTPALPNGTTGTTQTATDNSLKIATTAFVQSAIATGSVGYASTVPAAGVQAGNLGSGVLSSGGAALVDLSSPQTITNKVINGANNTLSILYSELPSSSTASIVGYPGGSNTTPELFTQIPSNVLFDVAGLVQSSSSDTIPLSLLPSVITSYPNGSVSLTGSNNGTILYNASSSASTFTFPPINSTTPPILPSAFQALPANFGSAVTTLAQGSSSGGPPTFNGGSSLLYLPQYGWAWVATDGTGGSGNFVILEGGGYQFNSVGAPVFSVAIIAPGFVPSSASCGASGTGRIATYTGGGLTFCTNGAGVASLDASGDLAIIGYLSAQEFISGTVLIPTGSALSLTAGVNYPSTYQLGFTTANTQDGWFQHTLNLNYTVVAASTSSKPTVSVSGSHCTGITNQLGGMAAGSFQVTTSAANANCTFTISGLPTQGVTNEYHVTGAYDENNPAGLVQSGGSTSGVQFTGSIAASGDKVSWGVIGY